MILRTEQTASVFTSIFIVMKLRNIYLIILPSTDIFRLKGHVATLVCFSLTTEITTCSVHNKEQTTSQWFYCGCFVARLLFYQAAFYLHRNTGPLQRGKNEPNLISCSSWDARLQLVQLPTYFARLPYLYYCRPACTNAFAVMYACPHCVHSERRCRQVNHCKDFEKVTQLQLSWSCWLWLTEVGGGLSSGLRTLANTTTSPNVLSNSQLQRRWYETLSEEISCGKICKCVKNKFTPKRESERQQ